MKERHFLLLIGALILATALLLVGGLVLAQGTRPQADLAPQAALGAGFTYQGRLQSGGAPISGTCQMAFRLYDADAPGGSQVGAAITRSVDVSDGYFTAKLDFGGDAFDGDARWLGVKVECEGDADYTDLGRQALTAAPYALYALRSPWSGIYDVPGDLADGDDVVTYTAGTGLALTGTEFRAEGSPYANVVVVAKSGGDFVGVQDAIDSIGDAADDNPYLVWIAPGVYDEAVTMVPYVHIQGAGQEATFILDHTLVLTAYVSLRDLTVGGDTNRALDATDGTTGTLVANVTAQALKISSFNTAIYLDGYGTHVTLRNVTALAENGSSGNTGLRNDNATVVVHDSSFTARGGASALGIYNFFGGRMMAHDITALAENGGDETCALRNYYHVTVTLQGGYFTAHGGGEAWGIYNNNVVLDAEGVTVLAEDAITTTYGLYNVADAVVTLRGGSFTARGGQDAQAIHGGSRAALTAQSVTALAEDASDDNYGLYNVSSGDVTLHSGSFTARGASHACGIYTEDSGPGTTLVEAESVVALGEDASGSGSRNYGLHNNGADVTLRGGSFTAVGGSNSVNFGLMNDGGTVTIRGGAFVSRSGLDATGIGNYGTLVAQGITALGAGATNNYGLDHASAGSADVTQSVMEGATYSVYRSAGDITVSNTRLIDGATKGTITCVAVSYGSTWYENTCP